MAHAGTTCLAACFLPLLTPSLRLDVPASQQRVWGKTRVVGIDGEKKMGMFAAVLIAKYKDKGVVGGIKG